MIKLVLSIFIYIFVATIVSLIYSYLDQNHKNYVEERTTKHKLKLIGFMIIVIVIIYSMNKFPNIDIEQKTYIYLMLFMILFKATYSLFLIMDNKLKISEKSLSPDNKSFIYYHKVFSPIKNAFLFNALLSFILQFTNIFQVYYLDIAKMMFTILLIEYIFATIKIGLEYNKVSLKNMGFLEKVKCCFMIFIEFLKKPGYAIIIIIILIGWIITYVHATF